MFASWEAEKAGAWRSCDGCQRNALARLGLPKLYATAAGAGMGSVLS